jgi:hypothetical protein
MPAELASPGRLGVFSTAGTVAWRLVSPGREAAAKPNTPHIKKKPARLNT